MSGTGDTSLGDRIERICERFEREIRAGEHPRLEDFLVDLSDEQFGTCLSELLSIELEYLLAAGACVSYENYVARFPEYAECVEAAFTRSLDRKMAATLPAVPTASPRQVEQIRELLMRLQLNQDIDREAVVSELRRLFLPSNQNTEVSADHPDSTISFSSPRADIAVTSDPYMGRYRLEHELGRGAFGVVYLAHDLHLGRDVAVKRMLGDNVDWQLHEARMAARLDHPAVVPVYDVGITPENECYTVSKFIDGCNLAELMDKSRLPIAQTVGIVAQIAAALHAAHAVGLVHRDVKPANILIDKEGLAFLADFGLALPYENLGTGPSLAGSPSYMSPEQARGDSHLVDGRTDIFSLGVVLYEMVVGRRPFVGTSTAEVIERTTTTEPWPPRMVDDSIPQVVEAICLKALAKPINERYTTARDMADELKQCCTYAPSPIDTSAISLPQDFEALTDDLSRNNHDVWARGRIGEGWQYGDVRNDDRKMHPDLVPYDLLTVGEQEYDRQTVIETLKAAIALGFEIRKP
jgi:serine/threonine protein kinase